MDFSFKFKVNSSTRALMRGDMFRDSSFNKSMASYLMTAGKLLKREVQNRIRLTDSVATGFMRKNVLYNYVLNRGFSENMAKITVGTMAWYDILVHEGLGVHSGSKSNVPAKYLPTPEQLAVIVPAVGSSARLATYKPSPRVPRPFLRNALKFKGGEIASIISKGYIKAFMEYMRRKNDLDMREI